MALATSTRLGPYEILAELGRGGMGEVYRARDSRLGRDVAIKVLPASFAEDTERRTRFEREAQAVAALSHPNVIAVFDTGVHEGQLYVVMELLAGETLRDRLTTGPLPIRKAVETAVQIARGLSAAHDKGVVHRDLKPENVFLLADGQVKILDFGLAQQITAGSGATETVAVLTGPGTVKGTVGYMAPEQVRGQPTDARTDLFALGAVLYEMLAGQRAFRGETSAEIMTAILREDPPELAVARSGLSSSLDRIVRHCMEKNPPERFQTARDVAFALEALSGSGASVSGPAQGEVSRRDSRGLRGLTALPVGIAGLVLAAAAFAGGAWWSATSTEWATEWAGHDLGGSPVAFAPRVSPDGKDVAFLAMSKNMTQVAVMNPGSGSWRMLTSDRGVGQVQGVVWSNDGTKIWFWRSNESPRGVFSVTVPAGHETQYLKDAASPRELPGGDLLVCRINADGRPQLHRFRRDTQNAEPLNVLLPNKCYSTFRVFPDGREVVVFGRPADAADATNQLHALDLASGQMRRLATGVPVYADTYTFDMPLAISPDGKSVIFVVKSGDQFRIVATSRESSDRVQTLFTVTSQPNNIDVAPDGAIYVDQVSPDTQIARITPEGQEVKLAELANLALGTGALALPDGRFLAEVRAGGTRRLVAVIPGREPTPFVPTLDEETLGPIAMLGPDQVVFLAGAEGRRQVAVASISEGLLVRRLARVNGNDVGAIAGAPDGKTIFYVASGVVWSVSADDGEPKRIRRGDFVAVDPHGQYVIVQTNEKDTVRLVRVPLSGGPEAEIAMHSDLRIAPDSGLAPNAINPDGRILVRVVSRESWFWPPAILDQKTGSLTPVLKDWNTDYTLSGWSHTGDIVGVTWTARSRLWRFRPLR
jgi:eukaryotic-like serine/threonine-protein kinase